MINSYFNKIKRMLENVENSQMENMRKAASYMADTIRNNGIIHLFGCGHSHILTEEVYYRAGGLVPIHPILHEPLMLHEGALKSSELERSENYAIEFMQNQDIRNGDLMFVISTSGRNPVPVDVALYARKNGATVICITSKEYSSSQPSRHPSGKYLYDAADLVIDNHSPVGDAIMSHHQVSEKFSPSSTVTGASILNAIVSETVALLAESGYTPPIFLSGNMEGADTHNQKLVEKYKDRVQL
ncbi:MAG TPA: SIS domain-containing protein [Candidatus Salinicoccus stercoripullorum]|uniref:UPF0309 protein H9891_04715 n=1 Tax=Candidatus Salinicoccus stercoripullorum TaxID=2838756 RepID=A0A9D1QH56_9STAP|nr:SIS domain-containing protein [Candidatus Salinicoccus stercoripullorum]